ncbi:hypothetical protein R1sor_017321 [Riccia sorocarpa]|uniref:FCP1 homology domain-containing protein n=1 Tax=Riccia sorocarpa TaxID=122646 RepID=A0ABD3I9U5_9MARC
MEFITSFNDSTNVGVVRGHRIRIDDDLVRTVFDVPARTLPISPCIRSSKLQDWMPIRDEGRFPGCETPWDDTRLAHYNFSGLIAESIRHECAFMKTDLRRMKEHAPHLWRFAETFIGIPLTLIFLHLEIVTEAECEAGAVVPDGDSSSEDGDSAHRDEEAPSETIDRDILMDELMILRHQNDSMHAEMASLRKMRLRQPFLSPGESRIKSLVLDIFGLFVCVCRTQRDREEAASMGYTVHCLTHPQRSTAIYYVVRGDLNMVLDTLLSVAEVIIWTSRSREFTQIILDDLEADDLVPEGLTKCDRIRPSCLPVGKLTPMKDLRRFYDMLVCTKDVLLVDVEVARNSPNHPFSAVHPWPFGLGTLLGSHDDYVMDRLLPWLTEWFWEQQLSEADRRIIWYSVSRAEGLVLAEFWPAMCGDVRPRYGPGAEIVETVVCEPIPEPSLRPISADSLAEALDVMLPVSRAERSIGPTFDPLVDSGAEGGPEGSVGPVADPLCEPLLDIGTEGSIGPIVDRLREWLVDSGAEGSVRPVPDPSADQIALAQTVAELVAKGSAASTSDE